MASFVGPETGAGRLLHECPGGPQSVVQYLASYLPTDGSSRRLVGVYESGEVAVWDLSTGEALAELEGRPMGADGDSLVTYVSEHECRPRIAVGFGDGKLLIWSGDDYQLLHSCGSDREEALLRLVTYQEPSGGRARLASGGERGSVTVWCGETGEMLRTLTPLTEAILGLDASNVGEHNRAWLVAGGEDSRITKALSLGSVRSLTGHFVTIAVVCIAG
jgi:WD40 repeat protein